MDITYFSQCDKMHDVVVQHIAHRAVRQDIPAQVHHSDVSCQSGDHARVAPSSGYEPNVGLDESGTNCMSIADRDGEDPMRIENSLLGQATLSKSLRGDPGAAYRAAQRQGVHGEVPILPQGVPCRTQHLMHDTRDSWENQGHSALHYQQEQF